MPMDPIEIIEGRVAVLDRADVDTDQIIPKQFLKRVERSGFGEFLFYDWAKEDGWDLPPNPILATGPNFGSGSSREHAPWALQQYGFKAVIAPSFADIFFTNSFKNGFLPIALTELEVDHLFNEAAAHPGYKLTIDLGAKTVTTPSGKAMGFDVDATRQENLLNGLDEIGLTLRHSDDIRAYEEKRKRSEPWIFS